MRSEIPAVTHVDYSARIQTVHRETNPRYHALLSAFSQRTGCPVLVNTSFNVRGEPIVCTPEDAWRCFMGTAIDSLAIGNCFLDKAAARFRCQARIRGNLRTRLVIHNCQFVLTLHPKNSLSKWAHGILDAGQIVGGGSLEITTQSR